MTREEALDILDEGTDVVLDEIVDTGRWSIHHRVVIRFNGKLYRGSYSVGATENQDESPWEYETPVFTEVEAYEKTVTDYRKVA